MKKPNLPGLLILVAFLASLVPAQAGFQTLTQCTDNVTVSPGTFATCNTGATAPQYHWANSFWRAYEMATSGVGGPIDVTCIRFGVEFALGGTGGEQPLELRLYIQPSPAVFPAALPTAPVHTEQFMLPDSANLPSSIFTQGLSNIVTVQPSETLIVELYLPNGVPGMNVMFPGGNSAGQSAPCYISTPNCAGLGLPTSFATLGLPNPPHLILDVIYVQPGFAPSPTLAINIINADPVTGLTTFSITNGDLLPGHEIWNFYSWTLCATGPYLGLCFPNPNDLTTQLATPLGYEPLHYLATGCSKTMGPFTLPTGITIEIVTVDFDSTTGSLNGWSSKLTQTF